MALPILHHGHPGFPGSPAGGHRHLLPEAQVAASTAKQQRRADDVRRLRRVKDSREQLKKRTRTRAASSGTVDTTTSLTSTSAGRSYTVANVHNGVIYLRPVVRAGNQRTHALPDPFVFPPQTPPDSATLDSRLASPSNEWHQNRHGSTTPTSEPTSPPPPPLPPQFAAADNAFFQQQQQHHHHHHHHQHQRHHRPPAHAHTHTDITPTARPIAHVRSHSFSTSDNHTVTSHHHEPGTFKVVIERPPFGRPKTADTSFPMLQVPIPNYRLGTPRFSTRGTVDLRSSVYTRTSGTDHFSNSMLTPQRVGSHSFLSSRPHSDAFSPVPACYRATMERAPLPITAPSSARVSQSPIGPKLFDALTTNPDDTAIVRFSPSGELLAATPSRLVAHITSPSFLDYELLSNFFLTFRAFLCTRDLVAYLISRLRWAVDRQDDFGRIVRVRTFVALRHWILNYFVDDFMPNYPLRVYFCTLVNSLYEDLQDRQDGGGGDIKIVGELKKCWRRTCALYWETQDGIGRDLADEKLLPGGPADSSASFEELACAPPTPTVPTPQTTRDIKETIGSNPSDQFASKHMDWAQRSRHTPQNSFGSPYMPSHDYETTRVPLSPESEASMHVLSCSIPMRGMHKADQSTDLPLYPHPVPHPVPHPAPVATTRLTATPQRNISVKKSNRSAHGHKRSGSFSDALRDSRSHLAIPKNASVDLASSALANMPGSLVHGGLFQPNSPYIEVPNNSSRQARTQVQLVTDEMYAHELQVRPGHATSPGMKKILGTVRRALSTRQNSNASPYLGNFGQQRQTPYARSSNQGTTAAASGGPHKPRTTQSRPQTRIDLLSSAVVDSFKEAVEAQLTEEQQYDPHPPDLGGFEFEFDGRRTPTPDDRSNTDRLNAERTPNPRCQSSITNGSKSIMIIDDTGPPPLPLMSGALPVAKPDEEAAAPSALRELYLRNTSFDDRMTEGNIPISPHPELFEDLQAQKLKEDQRMSRATTQRSVNTNRRSMSEGHERMYSFRRRGSTKTSIARSRSLRRRASHNSTLSRRGAPESISTFQTMSSDNDPFFLDSQQTDETTGPARQLRRRPGGDLRAADNVHDLENTQRPHSTGSISNQTGARQRDEETNHEDVPKKKPISLVDTHSSQPNLRPSFEAEVAKLAALPDDTDDEGGVESALMKLEGRYEKKSPDPLPQATISPEVYRPTGAPVQPAYNPSDSDTYIRSDDTMHRPPTPPEVDEDMYRSSKEQFSVRAPAMNSVNESDYSYSSVPLLDREFSFAAATQRMPTLDTMRSSVKPLPLHLTGLSSPANTHGPMEAASANSSVEYVAETDSMKRIPRSGTHPCSSSSPSSIARESFLLDEDEELSDVETTTDAKSDQTSRGVSFFDNESADLDKVRIDMSMHPMQQPLTPPLSAHLMKDPMTGTTASEGRLNTPGLTPSTFRPISQTFGQTTPLQSSVELQDLARDKTLTPPAHLPFVLAYDSEILAQQFTVVEKDALDEIDWKELIELRWKQSSPQIRDWVHYLQTQEVRGVDVVIARFNLVVKWAVSECVLTESIEERAQCIVKFIHIAMHARRLRNYATMYQLAIALISNDVSRLRKTWALVPPAELQAMKELEALVQPLKNFHNLRLEMETAAVDEGCIPFIGIYTRDLIYNAQKPPFIDATPVDGERLVNFERYHTAAMIVKNLLRLLEASSKYNFTVEPTILSKCLWIAALSDEEIARRSRLCE